MRISDSESNHAAALASAHAMTPCARILSRALHDLAVRRPAWRAAHRDIGRRLASLPWEDRA